MDLPVHTDKQASLALANLASMVSLDSQGYQERLVLLESQEWQGLLVKEVIQDHRDCLELENQEKMVLEGNRGSQEAKGK